MQNGADKMIKKTLLALTFIFMGCPALFAQKAGDIVKLGSYPYSQNGAEKNVEWVVLEKFSDGTMLMAAKHIIDARPYSDKNENVTWDISNMRRWLNTDFLNAIFDENEKKCLVSSDNVNGPNPEYHTGSGKRTKDKVFLLSIAEVYKYFKTNNSRKVMASPYAAKRGAFAAGYASWWLRTAGLDNMDMAFVRNDGHVNYDGEVVYDVYGGIRPAIRCDISKMPAERSIQAVRKTKKAENKTAAGTGSSGIKTAKAAADGSGSKSSSAASGIADRLKAGDIIRFGQYASEPDGAKKPIEWIILEKNKDGTALLLSRRILDLKLYNEEKKDITWENCTLRKWLNESFYRFSFTDKEREGITETEIINEKNPKYGIEGGNNTKDNIFLLSISEAEKYFSSDKDRKAEPTKYSSSKCVPDSSGVCSWMLRSPGLYGDLAAYVGTDGMVAMFGSSINKESNSYIRPAMKYNLANLANLPESTGFKPAPSWNAEQEQAEAPAPVQRTERKQRKSSSENKDYGYSENSYSGESGKADSDRHFPRHGKK